MYEEAEEEASGDVEETWADRRHPRLVSTCPRTSEEYSNRIRPAVKGKKELELFYSGSKGQRSLYGERTTGFLTNNALSIPCAAFSCCHASCSQIRIRLIIQCLLSL